MAVSFRAVKEQDLPDMLALIKGLAAHERRPEAVTASVEDLRNLIFTPQPIAFGFVAEESSQRVGYALTALKFSSFRGKPILYIEDIYLDPKVRGSGAGQAFMGYVAAFALTKGCVGMEWSALDFNEMAITFYDKLGADVESGRLHFDADHHLMATLAKGVTYGAD